MSFKTRRTAPVCPHPDPIDVQGEAFGAAEVVELLAPHLSVRRLERLRRVAEQRSYSVAPVLEGLHDRGNISAVLRSAEAFGCQSVHIIETAEAYRAANRVTQGAEKWLDISRWSNTAACLTHLERQGYRLLGACHEGAWPIEETAFDAPTALVFGNEHRGLSDEARERMDGAVRAPMYGFSRSFNISVAAALCLYQATQDRRARLGRHGDLSAAERMRLLASFCRRSVPRADEILLRSRQS